MFKGKRTCKILKEIRRQIAENNDIEYVTSECQHQGDCAGTCPKCEAEVRYLERELERRARLGKAVTVAGLAATITATTLSATSCDLPWEERELGGEPLEYETTDGLIAAPEDEGEVVELQGDPALPTVYLPEFEQYRHLLNDNAALYDFLLEFARDNGSLADEPTYSVMSYTDWSWSHSAQSDGTYTEYFIVHEEQDPTTFEVEQIAVGLVFTPAEGADPEDIGAYLWTAVVVETLTVVELGGDIALEEDEQDIRALQEMLQRPQPTQKEDI